MQDGVFGEKGRQKMLVAPWVLRVIENIGEMMAQGKKWTSENLFRVLEVESNDLTR